MSLILHAADISNPGKTWTTHRRCAEAVIEEFFAQGDEEKKRGLPITPLCDRNVTDVPRTQVTFIEVIVEPCLTVLGDMFDYIAIWDVDESPSQRVRRKSRGVKKTTTIIEVESKALTYLQNMRDNKPYSKQNSDFNTFPGSSRT